MAETAPLHVLIDNFPHETIPSGPPKNLTGRAPALKGYLFVEREITGGEDAAMMAYAKKAIQQLLRWRYERHRLARSAITKFVLDILYKRFKHTTEIQDHARNIGCDVNGRHAVVFVCAADAKNTQKVFPEQNTVICEMFASMMNDIQAQSAPYALMDDGMAFIMKAPEDKWPGIKRSLAEKFAEANANAMDKFGLRLVIGAGGPVDSLLSCDKSFREAKRIAAMLKENISSEIPYFWEDMGVYKLLSEIYDTQEARGFVEEHLGELINRSEKIKTQDSLLQTLFCVIKNNWQLKPVASAMNLHYNTVKYRYRRIGEILGVDMESCDARMNLSLAMELHILDKATQR
jgi:purine catabolism regulator